MNKELIKKAFQLGYKAAQSHSSHTTADIIPYKYRIKLHDYLVANRNKLIADRQRKADARAQNPNAKPAPGQTP